MIASIESAVSMLTIVISIDALGIIFALNNVANAIRERNKQ